MNTEYKELKNRFDELSNIIKSYKADGVFKSTPPELYQEQNDVAVKMMKLKSVH